jgi:hypothetical protein
MYLSHVPYILFCIVYGIKNQHLKTNQKEWHVAAKTLAALSLVGVFQGLYGRTNEEVYDLCVHANNSHADQFPQNNETVSADIYKGRKVPAE